VFTPVDVVADETERGRREQVEIALSRSSCRAHRVEQLRVLEAQQGVADPGEAV